MPNIPAGLQNRLRRRLLRCAPVDSDANLRAVFSDSRIAQWQDAVPQADSPSTRVDRLIAYLGDHYNSNGESALLLFLHVLLDRILPADQCHQDLSALILYFEDQLSAGVPGSPQWEAALARYREGVRQRHGTTRIFGQPRPVPLDDIFTEVYIYDRPLAFRRFDIEQLHRDPGPLRDSQRIRGTEMLSQKGGHRLYILGKPGAGKTTFLKYLALNAAKTVPGRTPIFVTLKDWRDSNLSLLDFIQQQFEVCGFPSAQICIEHLLAEPEGALVLFDGLDEIQQEGAVRAEAIAALRDFARQYPQTQIVITCRVAATDYTFDDFTYVEVADFTAEQICTFVTRWFADASPKGQSFLKELNEERNRGLRELASQPLLLAMLCIAYNDTQTFPQRRVEIYYDALDALLRKWDSSRDIRRVPAYRFLSTDRKHQLFARIAAQTFEKGIYFIAQTTLENMIADYLLHIPAAEGAESPDAGAVLKAIEAQHGILIERAHRIYSFAHLTFQEYYTARYVVENIYQGTTLNLLAHAHEARWREVVLLAASLFSNADIFFNVFLIALNNLVKDDSALGSFLVWADHKAANVISKATACYHPGALRAYYISRALSLSLDRVRLQPDPSVPYLTRVRDLALDTALILMPDLDLDFADNLDLDLDLAQNRNSDLVRNQALDNLLNLAQDLALDDVLILNLTHIIGYARDRAVERTTSFSDALMAHNLKSVRARVRELGHTDLDKALSDLSPLFLDDSSERWQNYADQLQTIVIKYRNIGHNWNFSEAQAQTLEDYFYAIHLFLKCLNVAYVTDRAAIEDRLLLPPKTKEVM